MLPKINNLENNKVSRMGGEGCRNLLSGVGFMMENEENSLWQHLALDEETAHAYLHPMEIETTFVCIYCLQVNEIIVDASGGLTQEYVEDCQVCCRPNKLSITVDEDMKNAWVEVTQA